MLKNFLGLLRGHQLSLCLKRRRFFVSIALGEITTWHWGFFEEPIGLFSFPVSLRRIVTLGYSAQRGPCEASAVASHYYHRSGRLCESNDKLAGTPVEPWDRRNDWGSFFPKVPGFAHRPSRIS